MKLIVISDGFADIADGQVGQLQKLCGLCHAVIQEKILRGPAHGILEDLTEIASVQSAVVCDVLHRDVILKILLDISQGFMDVKIPELSRLGSDETHRRNGAGKRIQKEIQVAHGRVSLF